MLHIKPLNSLLPRLLQGFNYMNRYAPLISLSISFYLLLFLFLFIVNLLFNRILLNPLLQLKCDFPLKVYFGLSNPPLDALITVPQVC
jgi:hypothetical protein